ncbi:pyruvate dehydrogenase complex dihydrolipoamide acetyltransferase [Daejeonella lutea]|uniref:Acetyltransferase component of pyruvate dehydrogenase complex n=1 Tax=Daejeonella lutea TaxID=572036 RepID=A0A1T5DV17_9SPHI|nr:pyruvate dehydrogenase complex dihydrolipoamide acetyltransferase [Daejeonella lutea]SKB75243.1 pyruvate dehydrogenase E2 component (dihydrolipoamide acetyltransferase) [Daejeonella lutea]
MAEVVKMPKMSDTMTEGVIAKWHKKVGDKVKSGDLMAEIETDKATMDFESYQEGTLLYIGAEEGSAAPVDSVIAVIGAEGEDYKSALDGAADAPAAKSEEPAKQSEKPEEAEKALGASAEKAETPAKAEEASADGGDPDAAAAAVGATVIRMPLLSDTMTEGVIAEWHKKVGDKVKSDDALADVETDKATMEVIGYAEGTLLYIGVEKGQAAKVNGIIAIVGKEGTDVTPFLKGGTGPKAATKPAETSAEPKAAEVTAAAPAKGEEKQEVHSDSSSRVKASPLARKIAKDKGIDIEQVKGSAEGGRIVKKDIEGFTPSTKQVAEAAPVAVAPSGDKPASTGATAVTIPQFIGEEKYSEKPVSQMRKVIAKRLSESLFTAPHFYLTMAIDMDSAIQARNKINEFASVKISFNDIVLKAVAIALKQHPNVNSSWLGDKIRYNEHVNIGVAVAVEDGLLVPVVRFADGKSLSHISAEVKDFAQRAKAKKLQPSDWEGSTFTISNLGMFGIDEFTAIINPPDACILAVGGISQVPVVKNGQVVPGNVMKVTLSCDHRVVDGATGSAFLQTLKSLLEEPVRLLV